MLPAPCQPPASRLAGARGKQPRPAAAAPPRTPAPTCRVGQQRQGGWSTQALVTITGASGGSHTLSQCCECVAWPLPNTHWKSTSSRPHFCRWRAAVRSFSEHPPACPASSPLLLPLPATARWVQRRDRLGEYLRLMGEAQGRSCRCSPAVGGGGGSTSCRRQRREPAICGTAHLPLPRSTRSCTAARCSRGTPVTESTTPLAHPSRAAIAGPAWLKRSQGHWTGVPPLARLRPI